MQKISINNIDYNIYYKSNKIEPKTIEVSKELSSQDILDFLDFVRQNFQVLYLEIVLIGINKLIKE